MWLLLRCKWWHERMSWIRLTKNTCSNSRALLASTVNHYSCSHFWQKWSCKHWARIRKGFVPFSAELILICTLAHWTSFNTLNWVGCYLSVLIISLGQNPKSPNIQKSVTTILWCDVFYFSPCIHQYVPWYEHKLGVFWVFGSAFHVWGGGAYDLFCSLPSQIKMLFASVVGRSWSWQKYWKLCGFGTKCRQAS